MGTYFGGGRILGEVKGAGELDVHCIAGLGLVKAGCPLPMSISANWGRVGLGAVGAFWLAGSGKLWLGGAAAGWG
eukprot:4008876-Karenia_brevis.AAC.1